MTLCARCEHGMVQVTRAYAEKLTPRLSELAAQMHGMLIDGTPPTDPAGAVAYDLKHREWAHEKQRREALTNSWYPCPECRPKAFARWRHGCYESNHDATSCDVCGTGKRRR